MADEIRRVITVEDDASQTLEKIAESGSDAADALNDVNINTNNFKDAQKAFVDGLDKVSDGLDNVVPGTRKVYDGVRKMSAGFKALLKNPIGIALTAIVAVVGTLTAAIKNNEKAMAAIKKAFEAFQPVIDVVNKAIEALATGIAKSIEWIGKMTTSLFGLSSAAYKSAAEMDALARANERNQRIESKTTDEYVDKYKDLITLQANYRKATIESNEDAAKFLEENKSIITSIGNLSSTVGDLFKGVKTVEDLRNAFDELNESSVKIRKEMYGSVNDITKANEGIADMSETVKHLNRDASNLLKLSENVNEVKHSYDKAAESVEYWKKHYDEARRDLDAASLAGTDRASQELQRTVEYLNAANKEFKEIKPLWDKTYSEYQAAAENLLNKNIEGIKSLMIATGELPRRVDTVLQYVLGVEDMYDIDPIKVQETLNAISDYADDIYSSYVGKQLNSTEYQDILEDRFGEILDGAINNLRKKPASYPKIELPVDITIDEDSLSDVLSEIQNTDFKKTLGSDIQDVINSAYEYLNKYYSRVLEYKQNIFDATETGTLTYFNAAKDVEDAAWKMEEVRMEAEKYTNEQIEAAREAHNMRLKELDRQALQFVADGVSQSSSAIAASVDAVVDAIQSGEENEEKAFAKTKQLQKASAVISMLSGVASAVSTAMQLGPIVGPIVGAANAAAVIATCVAQITKINNTKFDNASASSVASSVAAASYNPTYTANTTGKSDIDQLQSAVSNGTKSGAASADVRVYVLESDITNAQSAKKVKVAESKF